MVLTEESANLAWVMETSEVAAMLEGLVVAAAGEMATGVAWDSLVSLVEMAEYLGVAEALEAEEVLMGAEDSASQTTG